MIKSIDEKLKPGEREQQSTEEKEKIDNNFQATSIGRPSGDYPTKQKKYCDMLNTGKINQPKQQTLEFYRMSENDDGVYVLFESLISKYNSNNMNLLELFSGTGSVGNIARKLGFNVISLDLKMLISTLVFWSGITNRLTETTLILFGVVPRAPNTAKQKQQELGISNMQIVLS